MSSKIRSHRLVAFACFAAVVATAVLASSTAYGAAVTMYSIGPDGSNWTDSNWSAGSGGPYELGWTNGDDARFEGGSGTITVGSVSLCGISFQPAYTLSGGTITLTGEDSPFNSSDYGFSAVNSFAMGGTSSVSTVNSDIAGVGGMIKMGSGTLHFGGASTYAGSTIIKQGTYTQDAIGSILMDVNAVGNPYSQFLAEAHGKPNVLNLNGTMKLDVADVTGGGAWTLVNSANFSSRNYGGTFALQLADGTPFTNLGGEWTLTSGATTWTFSQSTGVLTMTPEPGTITLLMSGLVGLLAYAWRKRK
jgi:autotransporter-associated beta strand protein